MRILAVGDIHGCSRALDTLLAQVNPGPEDRLVTLGDYVDRGPDSRGVLERLLALNATGRLVALRGNHELMMLSARRGRGYEGWLSVGGRQALASYAPGEPISLANVPEEHWQFMEKTCVDCFELETHFFVHANADPDLPLNEQQSSMVHWEFLSADARPHCSGKIMVCGHTEQHDGLPLNLGHAVCIDTHCFHPRGWLTCLDVASGRYWQANQAGETRGGWLDEHAPAEDEA